MAGSINVKVNSGRGCGVALEDGDTAKIFVNGWLVGTVDTEGAFTLAEGVIPEGGD